jgi:hypothetical protein
MGNPDPGTIAEEGGGKAYRRLLSPLFRILSSAPCFLHSPFLLPSFLLLHVFFWLIAVPSARCAVGISPVRREVFAEPGGPPEAFDITVLNTTNETRQVKLAAEEFRVGLWGELLFEPEIRAQMGDDFVPYEFSGARFIRFAESTFYLAPQEERPVRCSVQLPPNARGVYYAMITADPGQMRAQNLYGAQRDLSVTLQVSVMVFIWAGQRRLPTRADQAVTARYATEPYYDLEITDLKPMFPVAGDERQTLRIEARFVNRSNVHILADVSATLRSVAERRIVAAMNGINIGTRLLLPKGERMLREEVKVPLKPGPYQIRIEVSYNDPNQPNGAIRSLTKPFELKVPLAGVPEQNRGLGILGVPSERIALSGSPGKVARQEVVVYNNLDERLKITAALTGETEYDGWINLAPATFVIGPGQERTFFVRANIPPEAFTDIRNLEVALEPKTIDGEGFPEAETLRLTVVLRVLPPLSATTVQRQRPSSGPP